STENAGPTGPPGAVAVAAATDTTIPASLTADHGRVSLPLPTAGGLEPFLGPDSSSSLRVPVPGLPGEDVGPTLPMRANTARRWGSLPAGVVTTSATADGDRPALAFDESLPAEVVDMLDFESMGRIGPAEGADGDSVGDTDSDHGLVGFAIASIVGLAWG